MATSLADMLVKLDLDSAEYRTNIKRAGDDARDFGKTVESASRAASTAHEGHSATVIALKREMAGTQRTVNFFARSLNDIVPASTAAGEAVRLFGAAAVGGLGIGLAIEAVLAGVKLIADHFHEAQRAAEEFAKESAKRLVEIGDEIAKLKVELLDLKPQDATQAKLDAINKLLADRARLEKAVGDAQRKVNAGAEQPGEWYGATRALADFDERVKKSGVDLVRTRASLLELLSAQNAVETKKEEERAAREDERAAEEAARRRAALEEQFRQKDIAATAWYEAEKLRAMADAGKRAEAILREQAAEEQRIEDEARRRKEHAEAEARSILGAHAGPLEHYNEQLRRINDAYSQGALSVSQYSKALQFAEKDFIRAGGVLSDFGRGTSQALEGAFASFFEDVNIGLTGMVANFGKAMMQMVAQAYAAKLAQAIFSPSGGGLTSGINALGNWLGIGGAGGGAAAVTGAGGELGSAIPMGGTLGLEHFAAGGDIRAGQLAIVGEHGAEPFIPNISGRIVSHEEARQALGSSGGAGAQTFRLEVHPDAMHMTLSEWLEGELARQASQR